MLVAAGGINSLRAPDSGDITSTLSSFGAKCSKCEGVRTMVERIRNCCIKYIPAVHEFTPVSVISLLLEF